MEEIESNLFRRSLWAIFFSTNVTRKRFDAVWKISKVCPLSNGFWSVDAQVDVRWMFGGCSGGCSGGRSGGCSVDARVAARVAVAGL